MLTIIHNYAESIHLLICMCEAAAGPGARKCVSHKSGLKRIAGGLGVVTQDVQMTSNHRALLVTLEAL